MDAKNILSLSGVLLALGVAGYYWGFAQGDSSALTGAADKQPDYEVSRVYSLETDASGNVLRRIEAEAVVHFPAPHSQAEVSQPKVTLYENGQPQWQVTADSALSRDNEKTIDLRSNVVGQRIGSGSPLKVETHLLTVSPEQETFSTKAKVKISSPQATVQSTGLDANLKNQSLQLHSQVRGTYVTE